jgi:FtsZ-interacting cell division protein YlmF
MTIKEIIEVPNNQMVKMTPIKERQDIYIPDIQNDNISRRNGMVYCLTGSGGSGKTSLLLNMMKSPKLYRNKFHNIYYICPISSFLSVEHHPFEKHEKVYHELTVQLLEQIYTELIAKKEAFVEYEAKQKEKRKLKGKQKEVIEDEDNNLSESEEEIKELEYSLIIIDDMADSLKNNDIQKQLNKMIIKARHISCSFIFTLQSYYYMPKILRKQLTYITIFKPKNYAEWETIGKELLNLNKDDSLKVFDYIFDEPYFHIDIDLVNNKYYKNFNQLKLIS